MKLYCVVFQNGGIQMSKKYGLAAVASAIITLLALDSVLDEKSTRLERVFSVITGVVTAGMALFDGWSWMNDVDD
jgi:hypothetical protein